MDVFRGIEMLLAIDNDPLAFSTALERIVEGLWLNLSFTVVSDIPCKALSRYLMLCSEIDKGAMDPSTASTVCGIGIPHIPN